MGGGKGRGDGRERREGAETQSAMQTGNIGGVGDDLRQRSWWVGSCPWSKFDVLAEGMQQEGLACDEGIAQSALTVSIAIQIAGASRMQECDSI